MTFFNLDVFHLADNHLMSASALFNPILRPMCALLLSGMGALESLHTDYLLDPYYFWVFK